MATKPAALSFEQVADLREKTDKCAEFLTKRLKTHLATLYPILTPRRVFGKHVGASETVARADDAYAQLVERYQAARGKPFDLRADLDEEALSATENGIGIYPWQYTHQAGDRTVTVTDPFRWIVTFQSDYTPADARNVAAGRVERRANSLRHFAVNAIAAAIVVERSPGAQSILEDLRYEVTTAVPDGLGKLPMLTVKAPVSCFRPPDDLIVMATRYSGVPAFIEVIDVKALAALEDPFRKQVEALL